MCFGGKGPFSGRTMANESSIAHYSSKYSNHVRQSECIQQFPREELSIGLTERPWVCLRESPLRGTHERGKGDFL